MSDTQPLLFPVPGGAPGKTILEVLTAAPQTYLHQHIGEAQPRLTHREILWLDTRTMKARAWDGSEWRAFSDLVWR